MRRLTAAGESMNRKIGTVVILFMLVGCGGDGGSPEASGPRGVTSDEIVIGTHTDLSGGLATLGVPITNGLRMRFEHANDAGGIHGRRIRLVAEDTQYQMPNAVKATNKLLNVDNIFLMVGAMGTPMNIALMPRMFEVNVPSIFPVTAATQMYEPLHPMKFGFYVSYRDQIRAGIAYLVKKHGYKKICAQVLANDYGAEVEAGYEMAVAEHGLESVYVGHHKATETDFVGTVTAIKNSGCEMLALGPLVKDAILIYTAARDAGWDAPIVSNMVPYVPEVAAAANGATDGLFAAASYYFPEFGEEVRKGGWVADWYAEYRDRYGEAPIPQTVMGYNMGSLVVQALEAAGPEPTVEKVLAGLEAIDRYADPFGGPTLSLSATKHQAADYLYLYQVRDGKWVIVEENLPF